DWLSFFCFTYFTDRDGKFQLKSLAESAFDPLARTCRFMLTEEAHHMFVGETGIGRVVRRALEAMKEAGSDDPDAVRRRGAIDLPLLQRYLNFWFSSSLDLFGSEVSSNAASTFATGIKGRPDETTQYQDHLCADAAFELEQPDERRGQGLRARADAARRRAGEDGRVDRPARARHQQSPLGLRVRPAELVAAPRGRAPRAYCLPSSRSSARTISSTIFLCGSPRSSNFFATQAWSTL